MARNRLMTFALCLIVPCSKPEFQRPCTRRRRHPLERLLPASNLILYWISDCLCGEQHEWAPVLED